MSQAVSYEADDLRRVAAALRQEFKLIQSQDESMKRNEARRGVPFVIERRIYAERMVALNTAATVLEALADGYVEVDRG